MRQNLLFSAALLCLIGASQAAYGACPNGSNNSTGGTYCNTATLSLGNGQSSPYGISVSGLNGAVSSVSVTLNGFTHPYPYEVNLMLVSPNGSQALVFLGGDCGEGGGTPPNNLTMTLADSGSGFPPNGSYNSTCTATTYKPYVNEQYATGNSGTCSSSLYSSPAPTNAPCANNPNGSNTFTSVFTGASPNGTWEIYAYNSGGDTGSISGINLAITTEVTEAATTTSVSGSSTQAFTTSPGNTDEYTATVTSGGNAVNEGVVQFYDNGAAIGSTQAVNSSGQASYTETFSASSPEGQHSITATYTDTATSPKYEGSNSDTNPFHVFVDNHTTVSNNGYTFCNNGTITISSNGTTSPYPQHVYVNGLSGGLASVSLTLNNINGSYGLADWYVLLVGPDGKVFVPLATAGGYAATHGVTLTLSDSGASYLAQPNSDTAPASGTYLPTAYSTFSLSSPAPSSGYNYPYSEGTATFSSTFASENLSNPSQPWSLYIYDDGGDTDTVGGYCLNFVTNNAAATTTTVSASPNPAITNTQVTLTATVTTNSGNTPVTSGSVKFEQQGNPTPLGTANLNGSGQASINFTPSSEGQYNITAIYAGVSGTYNTSEGSTTLQVDNQTTVNGTTYCNPGTITLTASSNTPQQYPSRVLVSNVAGVVSNVTVTLDGVTYSYNSDLEMMLAGPNSVNNLVFWGNVGGDAATNNQNFTIADGGTLLPSTNTSLTSGTYAPTVYSTPYTIAFTAPAPSSPNLAPPAGSATLNQQFDNTNPNGYWSFYVMEPGGGDHGSIGEHCINLTITPPALAISKSHTGSFTQGDSSDTYTITVTNNGPGSTLGTLTLSDTLPTGMTAVSFSESGHTGGGTGSDWTCTANTASCTRTTAMASGETDTFTLTVSVSYSTATGTNAVTNSVTVSGGGASNAPTANDQTTINVGPGYVLTTSVNPSGAGTVTANPTNSSGMTTGHYVPGTVVTLTANPVAPYGFSSWSGSADLSSTSANPTTITMNSATESVTANFVVEYTNVTSSVSFPPSGGFTYNKVKKQGTEVVTIKNTSAQTIAGPIQLVMSGLAAGVTAVKIQEPLMAILTGQ